MTNMINVLQLRLIKDYLFTSFSQVTLHPAHFPLTDLFIFLFIGLIDLGHLSQKAGYRLDQLADQLIGRPLAGRSSLTLSGGSGYAGRQAEICICGSTVDLFDLSTYYTSGGLPAENLGSYLISLGERHIQMERESRGSQRNITEIGNK